jgi:hypothetical protein
MFVGAAWKIIFNIVSPRLTTTETHIKFISRPWLTHNRNKSHWYTITSRCHLFEIPGSSALSQESEKNFLLNGKHQNILSHISLNRKDSQTAHLVGQISSDWSNPDFNLGTHRISHGGAQHSTPHPKTVTGQKSQMQGLSEITRFRSQR